jgi:threonine dehydrogenase-like Zn-dependent dehydrogenase
MRAVTWHGTGDMRVDNVPDPKIQNPHDAVIEVTTTAICGSDLHLYDGFVPMMEEGDVIGHEPMGEVVETGREVTNLEQGDRVVVPFTICCGSCWFCDHDLYSLCDTSNPNAEMAAEQMGHSPAALFGYSHMLGGFAGGQAEYLRVPYANVGPVKVPEALDDEQALFLSDIFPTGYQGAEQAGIEPGDTVAVWGCGPVGQFAIQSAWMFDPERVIAIDRVPERLRMAEEHGNAETLNFEDVNVYEQLQDTTNGRGPDRCIDAVGAEAHAAGTAQATLEKAKQATGLQSDRPHVLTEIIQCCRKGGTVSVPGVYAGNLNLPFGAAMNKSLTFKMGQTHMQHYMRPLLQKVQEEEIDPSFVITHSASLEDAPEMYETFRDKDDGCIKVVLKP